MRLRGFSFHFFRQTRYSFSSRLLSGVADAAAVAVFPGAALKVPGIAVLPKFLGKNKMSSRCLQSPSTSTFLTSLLLLISLAVLQVTITFFTRFATQFSIPT